MKFDVFPVGSVCNIKNNIRKIIIVGYNLNDNDYVGVNYPRGYLNNDFVYFNHSDIEDLFSLGYKDSEFITFSNHLVAIKTNGDSSSVIKESKVSQETTSKYKFDENGILISDGTESIEIKEIMPEKIETTSKYKFDENGTVIA